MHFTTSSMCMYDIDARSSDMPEFTLVPLGQDRSTINPHPPHLVWLRYKSNRADMHLCGLVLWEGSYSFP